MVSIIQQKINRPSAHLRQKKKPSQEKFNELRISCHKLWVETGGQYQIPGKERTWTLSDRNKIENLLLLGYTSYPAIRGVFFSKLESKISAADFRRHR